MIEVSSVAAHPIANAIRCALSVSKTGVLALSAGSLVSIQGLEMTPHELMGYLVNLSFDYKGPIKLFPLTLSASDKTLADIVKRLGLTLSSTENVDLNTPILAVTGRVLVNVLIGTYTFDKPLTTEMVEEQAIKYDLDPDSLILATLPMHQERAFPFDVSDIGGGLSRIVFRTVPVSAIHDILNTFKNLSKM